MMIDSIKKYFIFNQLGYTLMEIIVVMAIFSVLMIVGSDFIINGFRALTFGSEQQTAIQNGRRALENLTADIREAQSSERGDYALSVAQNQRFIWYGDVDKDGTMEKIDYFVDNSSLKRVVTEPGPTNDYNQPGATTTIAKYINNQTEPLFYYYNSDDNETSVINEIRLVKIKLKINVTPEKAPADYYLETDVNLRNLKDNL